MLYKSKIFSKIMHILLILFFWTGGFLMQGNAQNLEPVVNKVFEKKLSNGLTVLYYPYKRSDVVNVRLCVKVGSAYETEKEAGLTHLIEHMIFKGTETKKPEDIVGAIEALGGYMNAFTSYDYTCYYAEGPSVITEKALDILSDVVFHPYFDPQELEKEKEVVIEEMKMRLDNPFVVLFENIMKATYKVYPYRRPIIGYEDNVRSFKRNDLLKFVNNFYTPENMVLTIVGNISRDKVFSLVDKYFSNLPERSLKKVVFPEEPFTDKPCLVWIERPVKEGYFAFTLPGASFRSEDAPLLDLLAQILGGGESSRLYLKLKRKYNLVKTISASSFTPYGPGVFEIFGTADPQNFKEIVKKVIEELENIKNLDISEKELNKAKTQILSDFVFSAETSEGLAGTLSSFQLIRNTYKDILWYENKIKSATCEDLKRVAQKYFNIQKLVAGFLSEKQLFNEKDLEKMVNSTHFKEKPDFFVLNNGLKVILYPQKDLPTIGLTLAFPGGLRFETQKTNGLFQALALLWTRGTKKYTAEELSDKLESLGATIKGFSGRNTFGLKASFLSYKSDEFFDIFKDVVLHPSFDEKECDKARPELISLIFMQQDQPISLAINDFLKVIFPDHSYGLNIAGNIDFYQKFSSKDLISAYNNFVNPEKGTLVIAGNFDPVFMKDKIEELFKNWKGTSKYEVEEKDPPEPREKYKKLKKDTFQTQILLGFQTPGLTSKEKVALEVLNAALSGQDGRLFRILRDERSLAYTVTSFVIFYPKKSAFVFYIGCSPEKQKEAISGFWEILNDISKNGLTPEEIEKAKNRLIGRTKLNLQSNISIAEDMAVNEVLNLGWDYSLKFENMVKSITQEDIKNLICKYFKKEKAVLLVLGK